MCSFAIQKIPPVNYRTTLYLFLGTLVLGIFIAQFIIYNSVQNSQSDSHIINVAGSQRMYSQKIVKSALLLVGHPKAVAYRTELESALVMLETQHWALQHGSEELGLEESRTNSVTTQSLFDSMQDSYLGLTTAARELLETSNAEDQRQLLSRIASSEQKFLPLMDAVVGNFEKEARARIEHLQETGLLIAAFLMILTIVCIFLLIQPLLRRFHHQNEKLGRVNTELIQQKNQLVIETGEIKEEIEYLTIAKQKAEEATLAKSNFLSNMSHEIRTPMNAVIGMTHVLLEENPREDQREHLETVMFSAENLLVIINDILDYSKMEAGRMVIERTNFDIRDVVNNIYKTLVPKAKAKQLIFQLDLEEDVPRYLVGDPTRLTQVLINLLNNAIKFTEDGKIMLTIHYHGKSKNGQAKVHFEVRDTGIGIPQEKQKSIFESFSQADEHTTRLFGGTGLGLAITKRLIELQGGLIKLQSTPGVGSNFSFALSYPIGEVPQEDVIETKNVLKEKGIEGVKRILIVEDNVFNVKVVKRILKFWDMEIDIAGDGFEALEKIREKDYNIVLMDLQMPRMDGYEATATIRSWEDNKYQSLPIVALSASALADFRQRAFDVGMNDFLTKPFKPKDLFQTIERHAIQLRA